MLGAIQMPTWLVDFWTVYGEMITPVLVTLVTAMLTALALKIRSDAKVNATKADLQLEALKNVANREDNKPELNALKEEVDSLKQSNVYLAEIINLAFQNTNLSPEIKANLASLYNKMTYGSESELIKQLEEDKQKLEEQIEILKQQTAAPTVAVVEEDKRERTRR